MSDAIDRAAEVIRAAIDRQADIVADGLHLDVQGVITPHWIAEALATNGLLAQRLPAEGDGGGEREPTVPASRLRAFARLCVDGGDMTPAAARMLDRIIDGDGRAEK